jgi:hypothetical protein
MPTGHEGATSPHGDGVLDRNTAKRRHAVITGIITEITHITTKQDYSRWTRAHADVPGIKWSVFPGPGGTMIIVEYAEDRRALVKSNITPDVFAAPAASSVESAENVRVSADNVPVNA